MKTLGLKALVTTLLWFSLTHSFANTNEFRGYWVDVFHPGMLSSDEVTTLVDTMRGANCNAIVAEVRARANAYYNGSPYEPKGPGITPPEFDPLGDMILKGHDTSNGKQRLEIHAWLVTYKTSVASPSAWMHKNFSGTVSSTEYDPGHPDVQRRIFDVAMDILTRYDIDGLNFDYIRYPENTPLGPSLWGYNDVTVARFNARFGRTGKPDVNDPVWNQFRRDQVTSLIRKVYLNTIALKPWVKVSADTITWNPSPASVIEWTNSARAYNDVLQDWRSWMEEGIIDYSIPMNYYRQGVQPYPQDYQNWMNFAKDHQYNRHTIIGPGTYLNFATNAITQFRLARDPSPNGNYAKGVCGFSYFFPSTNNIVPSATMYQALVQPSVYDTNPVPIFAQRATIPEMPWKTAPTKGHIKGYISGGSVSNYLDGASFTITGPVNRNFISDATGFYGSVDLPPGNYTVTAFYPGLGGKSTNIVVTAGVVTTADLILPSTDITITTHPQNQTVAQGTTANFSVQATGAGPLRYQWRFNSFSITNATNSTYAVINAQPSNAGVYSVVVSNDNGQVLSGDATLTVIIPPTITVQPESRTLPAGTNVTFSVTATGTAPLNYQWRHNGTNLVNATNSTYSLQDIQAVNEGSYSVTITNSAGTATSINAVLQVTATPPIILTQPQSQTISAGSTATFSVSTLGTKPMSYQWYFEGGIIANATDSTFAFTNAQPANAGRYSVTISNSVGTTGSAIATLAIHFNLAVAGVNGTIIKDPQLPIYPPGTTVTLTAIPNPNYRFNAWSDGGTNNPLTILMASNKIIQALFTHVGNTNEIIIDNPQATKAGQWQTGANASGYGADYVFTRITNIAATATATYRPNIPARSKYDIFIWYVTGSNRATNAPWLISCSDGDQTVFVNQQNTGAQWRQIASGKTFDPGTTGFVRLSNNGQDTSKVVLGDAVRLLPVDPPVITAQPRSQNISVGQKAVFFVGVTGGGTLSYQWHRNGTNIAGANSHSLVLASAFPADSGDYAVTISNAAGTVISSAAQLVVSPLQFSSVSRSGEGLRMHLNSAPGNFIFEGSSNFVEWLQVTNVLWTNGAFEITDPTTAGPQRFYRTRSE